ncbi:MAG TPA: F0F1 ATP synthase subunit epsilon [Streptosporangiaceae bacterium]|nr:F0F1 ATP synthase subunit epsilon [Streptosporangiaceae bacterium]
MTLQVELVVPEGELWAGPAELVIAKTMDGDIGVLTGHTPVLGILAEGSVVRIRPEGAAAGDDGEVIAAVNGGFFSVADDRISILAREAQLGEDVDTTATKAALDEALQAEEALTGGAEEPEEVRYYRALLRAAGDPAGRA